MNKLLRKRKVKNVGKKHKILKKSQIAPENPKKDRRVSAPVENLWKRTEGQEPDTIRP